jgi:hypothetical protein
MGNQARIAPKSTAVSTSTRNFPNRLGQGSNVYLASAELASVAAVLGKLPTNDEYQQYAGKLNSMSADIYKYLNFDRMSDYTEEANKIGMKIITIGVGTEKGGTIPLRRNGVIESYKRDKDNQIVITKLNPESLKSIAKATNGNYVNGANTKEVLEFVKSTLDKIQKTEFEATEMAEYQSQFQWFLAIGFLLLLVDVFLLERKTSWVKKLNLFNEK